MILHQVYAKTRRLPCRLARRVDHVGNVTFMDAENQ